MRRNNRKRSKYFYVSYSGKQSFTCSNSGINVHLTSNSLVPKSGQSSYGTSFSENSFQSNHTTLLYQQVKSKKEMERQLC